MAIVFYEVEISCSADDVQSGSNELSPVEL